jgi:hypothetical protein
MNEARFVDAVLDPDAKGLADLGGEAERPVRLTDAVHRGRLAVHLDRAPLQSEDGRGRRSLGLGGERRSRQGRSAALEDRASGQHGKPPQFARRQSHISKRRAPPPWTVAALNGISRTRRVTSALERQVRASKREAFWRVEAVQAIDFMPFLTHLYKSAELVALNGGFAFASIGRRAF